MIMPYKELRIFQPFLRILHPWEVVEFIRELRTFNTSEAKKNGFESQMSILKKGELFLY